MEKLIMNFLLFVFNIVITFCTNMIEIFKEIIEFFDENILGITFLITVIYLLFIYRWPCKAYHNYKTKKLYKREKADNNKKYSAKRCFEEGGEEEKNSRNHIYLVEKKNRKFHRIFDTYTLNQLGYPRPLRDDGKCFKISDGYTLGNEIKIHNIISDIKGILKLKNDN